LHVARRRRSQARRLQAHGGRPALPSGYQANVGTITALVGPGDHVFSDALNHASIIDGCRLSRATIHVYEHCNLQSLETMLAAAPKEGRRLIVSDSVFSMDGDRAPLSELVEIAGHYHSVLMVDEAHATGVFGDHGAGLVDGLGLGARVPVQMGTPRQGARQPRRVRRRLARADRRAGEPRAELHLHDGAPARRGRRRGRGVGRSSRASRRGGERSPTTRHISGAGSRRRASRSAATRTSCPFLLGDKRAHGRVRGRAPPPRVLVHAIRPPTVPSGTARLRVTPIATHTRVHLDRALDAFAAVGRELGVSA
jgi:7-keto-8-aminopelargonate synthetase-like enzyme